MHFSDLLRDLIPVIHEAGEAALAVYHTSFDVNRKHDGTQVTAADKQAEAIILDALGRIAPSIPVIAEESYGDIDAQSGSANTMKQFFLVDPVDGTADFIKRTDQFTVNIALVEDHKPVFGMIFAPVFAQLWVGDTKSGTACRLDNLTSDAPSQPDNMVPIKARKTAPDNRTALISNSGQSLEARQLLKDHRATQIRRVGSSLKFCYLAEGGGDFYPRPGRTMAWDTAAGQAILEAAGGRVIKLTEGHTTDGPPLRYGMACDTFENPGFIAWARA